MPGPSAPQKKKARTCIETESVDDAEYSKNIKKLDMELEKKKPSLTIVRDLMKLTVDGRHKRIQDKQPLLHEIVTTFPVKDRKTVSYT